jgi:DNA-binding NarL/FixJ family response regulator
LLSLSACFLLSGGYIALLIQPLYGNLMAKRYPSRYIAPSIIGLCFVAILIHTLLLEILRGNPTLMYTVYLVIAVVLAVLFFMLMPYLLFSFKNKLLTAVPETAPSVDTSTAVQQKASELETSWREILQANATEPLTDGELYIAEAIMLGYKGNGIAQYTKYALSTVQSYRKDLYSKLDIHETRELFVKARKIVKEE